MRLEKSRVKCDLRKFSFFKARRIASAVRQFRPSVCLSVCPSVRDTPRYCVKTTARSTIQFALSDSKMCLVL